MTSISDLRVAIPSDKSPALHGMRGGHVPAPRAGNNIPSPAWCLDEGPSYPVIHPDAPTYQIDIMEAPPTTYLSEEVARTYGYILPRMIHDHHFDFKGNSGDAFLVERLEKKTLHTTLLYDYIVILHPVGRCMTVAIYEKGTPSSFPFRHYNTINA